jgi:CRP/FNR family transcriptional regulator
MSEEARKIIEHCRFFRGLTKSSLDRILASARIKRFRHGELIFSEGDPCPGIFIVGTGAVRIFRNAPSGKQHVLHLAYEGATFAEVAAIGAFNCPAFAEAMQDTVCLLLPREAFLRDIRNDHELCIQLLGSMAGWVRHLVGMLDDIVLRDATSRVARHLLRAQTPEDEKEVVLPMLKRDLASHLNLTSETLSRTLRRLTDSGLIDSQDQRHIRIVNRKELEEVAEGSPPSEFT